jgi:LSD1 subclass zinc finger protein
VKKLICKLCDGTDLVDQDSIFVCQSCGAKYSVDEARKMLNGTSKHSTTSRSEVEVQSVQENVTTVIAKSFKCSGCGSSLPIPKSARGVVKCPFCKTDNLIESLMKNAEIASKGNINSGLPLSATPDVLHDKLLSILWDLPYAPLDMFDKIDVVKEERHCVPAYLFSCTGTKSFSYEKGVDRQQTYTDKDGDRRTETHTDWVPVATTASITSSVFAPGEESLANLIEDLYMQDDQVKLVSQLVDIEKLEYPSDVETHDFDENYIKSFNKYVKPVVEKQLMNKANDSIPDYTRNAVSHGENISKTWIRVYLGLYCVVYKYNNTEYKMWTSGDGKKAIYDDLPYDEKYENELKNYEQNIGHRQSELSRIPSGKTGWLITGILVSIIMIVMAFNNEHLIEYKAILLVVAGMLTTICILLFPRTIRNSKIYTHQRELAKNAVDNAKNELEVHKTLQAKSRNKYKQEQNRLKGIYANV